LAFGIPVVSCPREIREVADEFKDLLGNHYPAFTAALCGATFGVSCQSEVARFFGFSPSVSSLCRFYGEDDLAPKLNRRHRRRLLRLMTKVKENPGRYMWAIDDTLSPHSGEDIWGTYFWHDHNTGGTVFGHKILTLGVVDRRKKLLIPVFWEILHREVKGQKSAHEKGWEVALRLLKAASASGFPKLVVAADSWFAGEDFFDGLRKEEFPFVVEMRGNRIVTGESSADRQDTPLTKYFRRRKRSKIWYGKKKKWAAEENLYFRGSKKKLKVAAVANEKDLDQECFAFYVSNKLTWNASQLWAVARDRWAIEVQFRDLKQIFAFGKAAVRSKQSVETSISVSVIALTVIRLTQIALAERDENQYARPIPAGNIVRELQLTSLTASVSKLASDRRNPSVETLRRRLQPENLHQKPTEVRRAPKSRYGHGDTRKSA
jgi:DDE superfamily endonuclease